jgi:hypothetical protein
MEGTRRYRMSTERAPRRVVVRRITVDEWLADDLIRLVSCRLAEGVEEFFDRDGDWGPEREIWAEPKTYARKMGVPASIAPPWETLEEGQVFVSGEFEVVGDRAAPDYLRVSRGRKELLRIDELQDLKETVKRLYSNVLTEV